MLFYYCPDQLEYTGYQFFQNVIPGSSGSSPLASGSFVSLTLQVYKYYNFLCGPRYEKDWKALSWIISLNFMALKTIYILIISKFIFPAPTLSPVSNFLSNICTYLYV